jgi:hypothetical protein
LPLLGSRRVHSNCRPPTPAPSPSPPHSSAYLIGQKPSEASATAVGKHTDDLWAFVIFAPPEVPRPGGRLHAETAL